MVISDNYVSALEGTNFFCKEPLHRSHSWGIRKKESLRYQNLLDLEIEHRQSILNSAIGTTLETQSISKDKLMPSRYPLLIAHSYGKNHNFNG